METVKTDSFKPNLLLYSILVTLLTGIVTHGYAFFNMLYSHDCMLVYQDDDTWQLSLGRFLMPLYAKLRGRYYPPSVVGVLALLFIGMAVYLMIRIFNITGRLTIFLISAIMSTNATVALLAASYIHDIDAYMLAMLLAVFAVYLWDRFRYGFLGTVFCLVLSAGLYPAYIQVSVGLFFALAVRNLLRKADRKKTIMTFLFQMIGVASGCALYYITARIVTRAYNVEFSQSGNALGAVSLKNYLSNLPGLILGIYGKFWNFLFKPVGANAAVKCIVMLLLLFVALGLFGRAIIRRGLSRTDIILVAVLCILLPAGLNCIYIISHGFFHDLMMYSDYLILVFALIVMETCVRKDEGPVDRNAAKILPVLLMVIILDNFIYAGNIYLHKDMTYQSTVFTMTRVIDRLEQTEGYYPGAPVAFVGDIERASLNYVRDDFFKMSGSGSHFYTSVNYYRLYERYFQKLLGYPIYILPGEDAYRIQELPEVKNMPAFPASDSIKEVEGVFVVRISETDMDETQIQHK